MPWGKFMVAELAAAAPKPGVRRIALYRSNAKYRPEWYPRFPC